MTHDHDHDHSELSDTQLRVRALETVLTEKGYVDPAALDAIIEAYETRIGPRNGAAVVAKAWSDPAFKQALLADGSKAVATLGHVSRTGDHLVVVENTPTTHNMVVCTLCSCYPWEILGLPPIWYKSAPYRSRAVKDPRGVLRISASRCRRTPKSASGTRRPKPAFWCCRCGLPALTAGAKSGSPNSSPATR
jgi:nitrile hydratase subunit alpha